MDKHADKDQANTLIRLDEKTVSTFIFWMLPAILGIVQFIFIRASYGQIRYEELAESVRNVFWLENRVIYDGISSNIGWYGTLMFLYRLFGFSLHLTKYYRFALHIISLFCLYALLKKYLGIKRALIPFVTFAASPTLLYLNTLQTSYGTDLQYLPITLFLLLVIRNAKGMLLLVSELLFWIISMVAWMSYPPYVCYLPVLFLVYFFIMRNKPSTTTSITSHLLISLFFFLLPLISGFLYVSNRNLLIYDSVERSGIFRGAGSPSLRPDTFLSNSTGLMTDLFSQGNSYYFEYVRGEFSDIAPIAVIIFTFIFTIALYKSEKRMRKYVLLAVAVFVSSFVITGFTLDPTTHPGIRRFTPVLASFYAFFFFGWYYVHSYTARTKRLRILLLGGLLLLPLHHALVLPHNLAAMKIPSKYAENAWFAKAVTPDRSLTVLTDKLLNDDLKLSCKDAEGKLAYCRLSEIYGALMGNCTWNKLTCRKIYGYDPHTEGFIEISPLLWQNYRWPH